MGGNKLGFSAVMDDKVSGVLDKLNDKFSLLGKNKGAQAVLQGVGVGAGISAFGLLKQGVGAVTDAVGDAIGGAANFQKGMLNVNSIAHMSGGEFADMSEKVLNLSGDFGQTQDVLVKGLYDINSSGFAGAQAFTILEASTKAATAGLSDAGTAAAGITAVLNSYGLKASDAAHVSDVMFQTVNRGVVDFSTLSAEIGKTTALSSPLGVSFEEVGAGLSVMTRHGIDAENATTQLNAIMSSILQPSKEAADLAADLGIEWNTAGLKAKGLSGFLADMIAKTGGSQEKMATLLGDVRAIRGAFTLGAQGGKEFTDELAYFNDVAGVTDDVLSIQKQGLSFKLAQLQERADAAATRIGTALIPAITFLVDHIEVLAPIVLGAAVAITTLLIPALFRLGVAAIAAAGPFAPLAAILAAVGVAFGAVALAADGTGDGIGRSVQDIENDITRLTTATTHMTRSQYDELQRLRRELAEAQAAAAANAEKANAAITTSVEKMKGSIDWNTMQVKHDFDDVGDGAGDMKDETNKALQKIIDKANNAQKALRSLADEAIDDYFDPIIARDKLMANNAERSAAKRVLASKTATAAEKRDARAALHQLEADSLKLRVGLAEAGRLSKKEQATLLADLRSKWKTATGAAKAEIAALIAKIQDLQNSSNVNITVTGGSSGKKRRARGGSVSAGEMYTVGEDGEEGFVPDVDGTIVPHEQYLSLARSGSAAPTVIHNYIYLDGNQLAEAVDAHLYRKYRRTAATGGRV